MVELVACESLAATLLCNTCCNTRCSGNMCCGAQQHVLQHVLRSCCTAITALGCRTEERQGHEMRGMFYLRASNRYRFYLRVLR